MSWTPNETFSTRRTWQFAAVWVAILVLLAILVAIVRGDDSAETALGTSPSTTTAGSSGPASTVTGPGATGSPSGSGGSTGSTEPGGPAGTDTTVPPETTATTSGGGGSRFALPAEGTWSYHVDGNAQVGLSSQPIDEDAQTTVSRAGGADDAPEYTIDMQSASFQRIDTRRYAVDGIYLLSTTLGGLGTSDGGELDPPPLIAPWPLAEGAKWSSSWTSGDMHGTTDGKVIGERDIATDAGTFHCWDVQLDSTFTGDVSATQHSVTCWSPELGMAIEESQTLSGEYSNIPFTLETHALLTGLP